MVSIPIQRPKAYRARLAITIVTALFTTAIIGLVSPSPAQATIGTDDYPLNLRSIAQDATIDPWGFYNRECVSFVAWRLNNDNHVDFFNTMAGPNGTGSSSNKWGSAFNWGDHADEIGYPKNDSPAVGAVAWWSFGHVAYVAAVNPDGSITIEEYNYGIRGAYHSPLRIIPRNSGDWPTKFIHIKDIIDSPGTDAGGDFPETDTDGDGVPDSSDRCPTAAGSASTLGCPDSDTDGIVDIDDKCSYLFGTVQGCPSESSRLATSVDGYTFFAAIGTDGHLYYKARDPGGWQSEWQDRGSTGGGFTG
jgi:surface antigen